MSKSLNFLFKALASARSEKQVRHCFVEEDVGEYFGAHDWGIHLYDRQFRLTSVDINGIKNIDDCVRRYEELEQNSDPLLNYVLEHHVPVHEEMILPGDSWKKSLFYKRFCAYYNHEHITIAPIVGEGRFIGAIYFARIQETPAFNIYDLAHLSAVSTHLSATLAKLRNKSISLDRSLANRLTDRELQIAELVAQGLTNAEIGVELWISKNTVKQTLKNIFRKLDVSARAQMVAKLKEY